MGTLYHAMPLIHFVMLLLTTGQTLFYLKMNDDIAKFIRLFVKSYSDIASFMLIFALIILLVTCIMHVLGATFDDGGNFDSEYDSFHNDY